MSRLIASPEATRLLTDTNMEDLTPRLKISLNGSDSGEVALESNSVVIGRESSSFTPDLPLEDPGALISRRHCVLTQEWGSWWVEDCGSRNGTFLRDGADMNRISEKTQLTHGDIVCIVGEADETGPTSMWELQLVDPAATHTLEGSPTSQQSPKPPRPCVRWDPQIMRLEVLGTGEPRLVELRKQGYALIDHMAARNADGGGPAVVCSTDELIAAIWGPEDSWNKYRPPTAENLRDVVFAVRKEIEPDPSHPAILENQRGIGYKLHTA